MNIWLTWKNWVKSTNKKNKNNKYFKFWLNNHLKIRYDRTSLGSFCIVANMPQAIWFLSKLPSRYSINLMYKYIYLYIFSFCFLLFCLWLDILILHSSLFPSVYVFPLEIFYAPHNLSINCVYSGNLHINITYLILIM